jgi:hypothetical protein
MSEMVDRVARAMAMYQFGSPESWEDQIPMARAAIAAMREPTEGMVGSVYGLMDERTGSDAEATKFYQTMIDEALK